MQRELLSVELGTDALWSDLVRPSRSLLGPRRILAGETVDDAPGAGTTGRHPDDVMIEPRPVRIAL